MKNRFALLTAATALAFWFVPSLGFGQAWAEKMFGGKTSHDFGFVARGAKVEHAFTVENIYEEDIHIESVKSSCSCTTPELKKNTLKTWEKVDILAKIDTTGYHSRKDVTLTVKFGHPFPAEVRLQIHVYIRSDVVVQPGSVQFGRVAQGAGARRKLTLSHKGYPGQVPWQVLRVETKNPHLAARAYKAGEAPGNQVTYELYVWLRDSAPVGYLRDQVVLVTNDAKPSAARVPIAVEAVVAPAVSVSPSPLSLGVVNAAGNTAGRLVVRGKKPFKITDVKCDDARFRCAAGEKAGTVHLVSVAFTADDTPGKVTAKVLITTDETGEKPLEVPVYVQVMSQRPAASGPSAAKPR